MNMNEVLREKRKALGLTQEQVANYLNITSPAVNKWEKGLSCPDIALLPTLARLLKTDPNTLLCFKENLSEQEVGLFIGEAAKVLKSNGFSQGFSFAMSYVKEYPHCAKLKQNIALLLEGALLTSNLAQDSKSSYALQIDKLYEEVAVCEDESLANTAKFMLASKYLQKGEYEQSQELLNQIPQKSQLPDTQSLQANLLSTQGKSKEAAVILEQMALNGMQETLIAVTKLIPILIFEGKLSQAEQLAQASKLTYETFGLWQYSAYLAPMQLAISKQDIGESLAVIALMLDAALTHWDFSLCPLYCHQSLKKDSENLGEVFLSSLLSDLENNAEYSFLKKDPAFKKLIAEYKLKIK